MNLDCWIDVVSSGAQVVSKYKKKTMEKTLDLD